MRRRITIVLMVLMLALLFSCPALAEEEKRSTEISAVHFYSNKAYYDVYEIDTMMSGRLYFSKPALMIRDKKAGDVLYIPFDAVRSVLEFFEDVKYTPDYRVGSLCKNNTMYVSIDFLRNFGITCSWERWWR